MESLALIAPLIILFPSVGAFINFFWGNRLGERNVAILGSTMSGLAFVIALVLLSYLSGNYYQPMVVNPPLLDTWIRIESAAVDISWQMRVDTLSVTMMLFVTFVGTLIHIYAAGYMHGDERYARFFAYLNMFLAFMLTLVSGNNLLMMFVGWEGVGLSSYLLIGFWWDKAKGVGWKNSNAARKAFIANRVGDFGLLMAMFLVFWAFGTLDFYRPTEVTSPAAYQRLAEGGGHGDDADHGEGEADHGEGEAGSLVILTRYAAAEEEEGGDAAAAIEGDAHHGPTLDITDNTHLAYAQMGIFTKTEVLLTLDEGETIDNGRGEMVGRSFDIGGLEMDIETLLILITFFMLLGAAGKSAQIPLFVWLPDAMAGPTPVSALIHAATMVTAGVYMMVRANVFFYNAELISLLVTLVGVSTAIVGGFIALGQFDIKRVLAYSTVSQLGFMVAAVGLGAYPAAMFHMITHAFFKALLFLGSGSVIHGVEHGHHHVHEHGDEHGHDDHGHHDDDDFDPQDMRNMGGLRSKMPITYWTYIIGTFALAGIWPFAGFWSKDEILADAWLVGLVDGDIRGFIGLAVLLPAAGLTAFYMWRQIEMVFHGEPRSEAAAHAPESHWTMTTPLVILAFFSLFIGFINIPSGVSGIFLFGLDGVFGKHLLGDFLEYSVLHYHLPPFQPLLALFALGLGVTAIFFASRIYGNGRALTAEGKDPLSVEPTTQPVWSVSNARMYWDEIYDAVIIRPFNRVSQFIADVLDWQFLHDYFHDTVLVKGFNAFSKFLSHPVDLGVIDGLVNGIGRLARASSGSLRQVQTGYVRVYAVVLFLGVVAVIVLMLLPMIQG